jgi:hypothetical protein
MRKAGNGQHPNKKERMKEHNNAPRCRDGCCKRCITYECEKCSVSLCPQCVEQSYNSKENLIEE